MTEPILARRLPTLETPNLRLRHVTEADGPALWEIFSDPEVTRFWSWEPWERPEQGVELAREIQAFADAGTLLQWGIATAAEPERLVGTCTLANLEPAHRRASVGYAVARAHWGRGIAGEAVARMVRYAFEELDLHRLGADADPRNAASVRLLERLGFRAEGLLREHYWHLGEWQDGRLFGLLRAEWEGTR